MKKISKNSLSLFALSCAIIFCTAANLIQKPDLSGKWNLNIAKSSLANHLNFAYKKINISQGANSITIENFIVTKNGSDSSSSETLDYNGEVSKVTLPVTAHGIDTRYRKIEEANDGKSLTISEKHEINRLGVVRKFEIKENWTLSTNGENLFVNRKFYFAKDTINISAVYDKI